MGAFSGLDVRSGCWMLLKSSDLRRCRAFPLAALPLIALLCAILISRLQIFLTRKRREIGELAWVSNSQPHQQGMSSN
jgi:hypothetical protein